MNKTELIAQVADKLETSKAGVQDVIDETFETMADALAMGDKVMITDFGTLHVSRREAFEGTDPRTGESIPVPPRRIPVFKPGKGLKTRMNPE